MADDVGFRQRDINRVIESLAKRLMSLPAQWPVISPLIQALESLPTVQPERLADTTVMALRRLAKHHHEETREAGARKLSEIADRNETAQQILEQLLTDENNGVKAYAIVGLWRAGRPLIHEDALVRSRAAQLLEQWGPHTEAVPTLIALLQDETCPSRIPVAIEKTGFRGGALKRLFVHNGDEGRRLLAPS